MASFDECGIRFLSAASVSNYCQNPAYWVARYLMGGKQPAAPAMIRSAAIKVGALRWLCYGQLGPAQDTALGHYMMGIGELPALGVDPEELAREHDAILPMLDEFCKTFLALEKPEKPLLFGYFDTVWLDGISVPFMTKPDFVFEGFILDVHTTHALPSKPKPKDETNAALHMLARGLPVVILYATMKKSAAYTISPETAADRLAELARNASAIQNMVYRVSSPEEALLELPLREDHFLWTPDLLEAVQSKLPALPKQEITNGLRLTRQQ